VEGVGDGEAGEEGDGGSAVGEEGGGCGGGFFGVARADVVGC